MVAWVILASLAILPFALWFYGKNFSAKGIYETTQMFDRAIKAEARSPLEVEYKVGITWLFGWRVVLRDLGWDKEEFEPHDDIYDEEKLRRVTEMEFTSH